MLFLPSKDLLVLLPDAEDYSIFAANADTEILHVPCLVPDANT